MGERVHSAISRDAGMSTIETNGWKRSFHRKLDGGFVDMTRYQVFDGVEIVVTSAEIDELSHDARPVPGLFEIHHCQEGRVECEFFNGKRLVMNQDDISIGWKCHSGYRHNTRLPEGKYKAVTLSIYVPKAQPALAALLGIENLNLANLCNVFCQHRDFGMVLEDTSGLRKLFYALDEGPEALKEAQYKVKALDIIVHLLQLQYKSCKTVSYVPRSHIEVVHKIYRNMGEHLSEKVTIAELAETYHLSQTILKRTFKEVYGITIYQYIKQYRMHEAAKRLVRSSESVLAIANQLGYENASKFSAAFRQVHGLGPADYRREKGSRIV